LEELHTDYRFFCENNKIPTAMQVPLAEILILAPLLTLPRQQRQLLKVWYSSVDEIFRYVARSKNKQSEFEADLQSLKDKLQRKKVDFINYKTLYTKHLSGTSVFRRRLGRQQRPQQQQNHANVVPNRQQGQQPPPPYRANQSQNNPAQH
jgi:hypothetical protein